MVGIGQFIDVLIDSAGAVVGMLFYSTYHFIYTRGYIYGRRSLEEETNIVN